MASKSEYLKKYLRSKGAPRSGGASTRAGGLKLGSDDEPDARIERKQNASGGIRGSNKKTLFQVLRRAADGDKYLFKDTEAEELPDSDEEEVRVVGEDGQAIELNEEDRKKLTELIAQEEGKGLRPRSRQSPSVASGASPEKQKATAAWKEAFAIEERLPQPTQPASAQAHADRRTIEETGTRDLSPPRRRHHGPSPPRNQTDTDSAPSSGALQDRDLSPPRRGRDGDLSPPRRGRDGDLSPPRRERDGDLSPPRRGRDADLSPPRRRQQDLSPPKRQGGDLVLGKKRQQFSSPPRRDTHASEERDLSPPRRTIPEDGRRSVVSPPDVANSANRDLSPPRRRPADSGDRNEAQRGSSRDADTSRKVVFRDREGRIISEEEWLTLEGQKGRKRQRERGPAPVLEWGSGLKQREDRKQKMKEEEKLAKQPFARYEIDAEYDADLKARDRWADPLANAPTSTTKDEDAESKQRPICPHDAPPNRFGIKPGYRWDGVVRGNGYEEERLKAVNRRKWEAEMAHMNNTADM